MKYLRGIILAAVAALAMVSAVAVKTGSADEPRRIEIVASKFSYAPSEITLKKGETVVLVLSTGETIPLSRAPKRVIADRIFDQVLKLRLAIHAAQ